MEELTGRRPAWPGADGGRPRPDGDKMAFVFPGGGARWLGMGAVMCYHVFAEHTHIATQTGA